jgi:hypothetical protein
MQKMAWKKLWYNISITWFSYFADQTGLCWCLACAELTLVPPTPVDLPACAGGGGALRLRVSRYKDLH